jgi:hypothetical protein
VYSVENQLSFRRKVSPPFLRKNRSNKKLIESSCGKQRNRFAEDSDYIGSGRKMEDSKTVSIGSQLVLCPSETYHFYRAFP